MIDPNHPFYEPLWRRVLIPAFCFLWAAFEIYAGETMWAVIVGGLGLYATWKLFIEKRKPPVQKPADEGRE
jgi:hypothetical protein